MSARLLLVIYNIPKDTIMNSKNIDRINIADVALSGATGEGISISIIDTGYTPDAQIVPIKTFGINTSAIDTNGHGSIVTGIIHNIAPEADLYVVNALSGAGYFTQSDLASGIYWSILQKVDIINVAVPANDLLGDGLKEALNTAFLSGVKVVSTTGYNGSSSALKWPSGIEGVIGVGSVNPENSEKISSVSADSLDIMSPAIELIEPHTLPTEYIEHLSGPSAVVSASLALAMSVGNNVQNLLNRTSPTTNEDAGQLNVGFATHTGEAPLLHHWEQGDKLTISYLIPKTEDKFDVSVTVKNNEVYYNLNDQGEFIQYTNGEHVHAFSEVEANEDLIGNLFGVGGIYEAIDTSGIEKGDYQVEVALIGNTSGQPNLFGSELIHLG